MSTSDQQGHGPLTRKQLREIRLTGSTPVITAEEAAAAAAAPEAPPVEQPVAPVELPAPADDSSDAASRLTRRQVREQERVRTASVPVAGADAAASEEQLSPVETTEAEAPESIEVVEPAEAIEVVETEEADEPEEVFELEEVVEAEIVTGVPRFSRNEEPAASEVAAEPAVAEAEADKAEAHDAEPVEADVVEEVAEIPSLWAPGDQLAPAEVDAPTELAEERPTVSPAFGRDLLGDDADHKPFTPSFDELLTVNDSTGSQHIAPSALIFTQSPVEGSLSGPVASTGEVLITGSYELPQGLGSQGHAHGTTDGKDVDAVLIDGELAPASSPTPIAASSAISTMKSAGEVIRPPAPEKGNKLMLTLAITAGGLALALAVALIVAFNSNVF